MQMTFEKGNRALGAALARVVQLPPPVLTGDVIKVGHRVVNYDDYSDSAYTDSPYDDYQDGGEKE